MEPEKDQRTRLRPEWFGVGALLAGGLLYVGLADPHRPGFLYPPCPFKVLTGWNCPGCGGLRMVHDLLHVDLQAAVVDNVFLLVGLPALALWVLGRRAQRKTVFTVPMIVVTVVLVLTWTAVRNVPGFPLVPTILDG